MKTENTQPLTAENGHANTTSFDNDNNDEYNDHEDSDNRAECGLGGCKPPALRMCARMSVFAGTYSFTALLTSTLSSYVNSQVTTLERHFGFNSSQTGLIMAANDVGFLVVVLFVSYIAAQVHIPRALGFVTILFGVSGIVCALPQFIFGAPSPVLTDPGSSNDTAQSSATSSFIGQLCDGVNDTSSACGSDVTTTDDSLVVESADSSNQFHANASVALAIIVIGMVLQGIAKTPRSSFIVTYVDANVQKTKTGFFVGSIGAVSMLGPALAFILGSVFTRIYVTLEETDMNYLHPGWIGAWWLGYIAFGCAACIFAIPLFFFPRRIKGGKAKKKPDAEKVCSPKMVPHYINGFTRTLVRLWTNPVYTCAVLSSCSLMFALAGGYSFAAKYLENQFSLPAWKANMAMAAMLLCTACLGTFGGGYLTKRFKMGPMVSLKFVLVMQILSTVGTGILIALKCDQPLLQNSPGPRASEETTLPGCYDNCACDDNDYFPVCSDDGRTFFSPCHAGCLTTDGRSYFNCTCIPGGTAMAGMCDYSCSMFYPYIGLLCFNVLSGTFAIIPKLLIYIRSVEERDKPMALGFSSFMASITGWMLGPIYFGRLIDGICIQWANPCDQSGACRLYDNDSFRVKLVGYQVAFRCLALVFGFLCFVAAKITKKFEKNAAAMKEGEAMQPMANGEKGDNKISLPDNEMTASA